MLTEAAGIDSIGPSRRGGFPSSAPSEVMMPSAETTRPAPPVSVWIVALVLGLSAAWQLLTRALPAFAAGDPGAFSELVGVALSGAIVWGLLRLRRWARSFTLVMSAIGLVIAAAALALLQEPDMAATLAREGYDPAVLSRMLTVLGLLTATSVVLLRTASAKRAFGIG